MSKQKTILIIGGLGFIGSHLAKYLQNEGHKILVIDSLEPACQSSLDSLGAIASKIEIIQKKVSEITNWTELLAKADVLIDSFGLTSHLIGMEDPLEDERLNLTEHTILIKQLKAFKGKKVLYLGTRSQYGKAPSPITEDSPRIPTDPQGVHKEACEQLYRIYTEKYHFQFCSLRLANCYGENQKMTGKDIGLIGGFIKSSLEGEEIKLFGDENRSRQFLYAGDIPPIVSQLLNKEWSSSLCFNLSGENLSLYKLAKTICDFHGKSQVLLEPFPEEIKHLDVGNVLVSDEKLKDYLGKLNFSDWQKSLRSTLENLKS